MKITINEYKDYDSLKDKILELTYATLKHPNEIKFELNLVKEDKFKFLKDLEEMAILFSKFGSSFFNLEELMEKESIDYIGPMGIKLTVTNKIENEQERSTES